MTNKDSTNTLTKMLDINCRQVDVVATCANAAVADHKKLRVETRSGISKDIRCPA